MGALEDIFAQYGVEMPAETTVEQERAMDETAEAQRLEGEWLLYSLKYPLSPRLTKLCARCGEPFQTNYQGMAHCSNKCCILELREKFGLDWKPANRRDKERWEPRIPASVIPSAALRAMKMLVAQAEADLGRPLDLGVPVQPYVLERPFRGSREMVSESTYSLPDVEPVEASNTSPDPVQEDIHPQPEEQQSDPFGDFFDQW